MKRLTIIGVVVLMLVMAVPVMAASPPSNTGKAYEKSADICRVVFVDYASPSPFPGWDTDTTDANESYKTHADARWVELDDGVFYTVYTSILSSDVTFSAVEAVEAVEAGFEEWDYYVALELFAAAVENHDDDFPGATSDDENNIGWESIDGQGKIVAMIYVWFNMRTKEVVEFDMVFDSDDPWGIDESDKFDVQNVATHEAGHTLFLGDLYIPYASELSMFGYVGKGETKKQTLGKGDVLGVQELYGPGPSWEE